MFIGKTHEKLISKSIDPLSVEIRSIEVCDSTNDYVQNLLNFNDQAITLSVIQLKGRGSKGRDWSSPKGGMWLSIGFKVNHQVIELSTPVVKIVHEILSLLVECSIKDPNDILIQGKKVAGILVEAKVKDNKMKQIIVGIGINVNNQIDPNLVEIATSLIDHITPPDISDLAAEISTSLIILVRDLLQL